MRSPTRSPKAQNSEGYSAYTRIKAPRERRCLSLLSPHSCNRRAWKCAWHLESLSKCLLKEIYKHLVTCSMSRSSMMAKPRQVCPTAKPSCLYDHTMPLRCSPKWDKLSLKSDRAQRGLCCETLRRPSRSITSPPYSLGPTKNLALASESQMTCLYIGFPASSRFQLEAAVFWDPGQPQQGGMWRQSLHSQLVQVSLSWWPQAARASWVGTSGEALVWLRLRILPGE